jgi:hypothetical protein
MKTGEFSFLGKINPPLPFAKLKGHLRAKAVRTIDALGQEIGQNAKTTSPPPDMDSAERPAL